MYYVIVSDMSAIRVPDRRPSAGEGATRTLTPAEVMVLAVVHHYSQLDAGCYYGGQDLLAKITGQTARTVRTILDTLIDAGLIAVHKEHILRDGVPVTRAEYRSLWGQAETSSAPVQAPVVEAPKAPRKASERVDFAAEVMALGVSEQTARDWAATRKAAKGVNTRTAVDAILTELRAVEAQGISVEDAARLAVTKGWRGFAAEWVANAISRQPRPYGSSRDQAAAQNTEFFSRLQGAGMM